MIATVDTRTKLLDAAERLFAEQGYAATALRQIQTEAGVNSAAVHYHFGSKKALFTAAIERRLRPIQEIRLKKLQDLQAASGDAVPVEELLRAYLAPLLAQGLESEGGRVWVKLLARFRSEPGDHWSDSNTWHEAVVPLYIDAFRKSLPHLPDDELKYRVFFAIGATVNTAVDSQGLAVIDPTLAGPGRDPVGVLERLIRFSAAALMAPAPDEPQPGRKRLSPRVPATRRKRS